MSKGQSTEDRLRALSEVLRDMESVESLELKLGGIVPAIRVETDRTDMRSTVPEPVVATTYDYGLAIHTVGSGTVGITAPSDGRDR
jgi:hypothetical protein